jgi:hypothetical protein
LIGKIACGDFSDISFVAGRQRRNFGALGLQPAVAGDFSDISFVAGRERQRFGALLVAGAALSGVIGGF